MTRLAEIKASAISKFLGLVSANNQIAPVSLLADSTEEIQYGISKNKPVRQFAAGRQMLGGQGATARLEENYLFDTRRFASGALGSGDFMFFGNAIGSPGTANGFVAGMNMTEVETNMDVASSIAQGKDFVMTQIGVSFSSNAALADLAVLLEAGALRFSKQGGQFTLRHGLLRLWPGGTGINGFSETTVAATTIASAHNGVADVRAVRRLTVPRVLRSKDTFNYIYHVPRAVSNLDNVTALTLAAPTLMTIWLWGAQRDTIPS